MIATSVVHESFRQLKRHEIMVSLYLLSRERIRINALLG